QASASQSETTTQSLPPRQALASQSGITFQPPPPRQALAFQSETTQSLPPHQAPAAQSESHFSRHHQLLLSQTPEFFDKPIRDGDYNTLLNYRVEDEHQFGKSSTTGMVRGAILEANAWPTIPLASHCPERS